MLKTMLFQFVNLPNSIPVKYIPRKQLIVKCGDIIMSATFTVITDVWCDSMSDLLEQVHSDNILVDKLSFY